MELKNNRHHHSYQYLFPFSYYLIYHNFSAWYRFLKKSQSWNENQIKNYQTKRMQSLISHAYHHVPYYHSLFKSKQIKPKDITSLADLKKIPVLTKDLIRKNKSLLKATNYPQNAFYKRPSGGITGKPLLFFVEKAQWLGIHFAFCKHFMDQQGYRWFDKVVSFSGIPIPVKHHMLYRTVELSSFHTTSKDFDRYHQLINRFKPRFINTFPSALLFYTYSMINKKKDLYRDIEAIFCHGERLHPWERKFLTETFECDVFDQYGHREQCVYATTHKNCHHYHVYPEYGIVELLDKHQKPITKEGNTGEIIATSLTNNVFPFIRYSTEDLAEITYDPCPCGNNTLLLKEIHGRKTEVIIGENHEIVPITGLYQMFSDHFDCIKEFQIIQEHEGEIIIHYVPTEKTNEKYLQQLHQQMKKQYENISSFDFQSVSSIQRTTFGKYRYFIQKLRVN